MLDYRQLAERLRDYPRQTIPAENLRPAAVLVPLFERDGKASLLFTIRTDHLEHHSGEISFPGGASEATDADLIATACRETEEEIGVRRDSIEILGRMDDFYSIYGYHVVPVVGIIPPPETLQIDVGEISAVFEAPVEFFRNPKVHHVEDWTHRGRNHPVDFYRFGKHVIWGLTAAILRQFLSIAEPATADRLLSIRRSQGC
jgi:8-oxo-dGTP pyrophosphatase MutT (NUDIX family)